MRTRKIRLATTLPYPLHFRKKDYHTFGFDMLRRFLAALFLVLFFFMPALAADNKPVSVVSDRDQASVTTVTHFDQMTYESTGCRGGCQRIVINGDGTIEIRGTEAREEEIINDTITPKQINDLVAVINASGFFAIPFDVDRDRCYGPPGQDISVRVGNQLHTVHVQCNPTPVETLIDSIFRIVHDIELKHALSKLKLEMLLPRTPLETSIILAV